MIKKILFCLLAIVVINGKSQTVVPIQYAIPNLAWINYYSQRDGVGNIPTSLDVNSNVYITGHSGSSSAAILVALKYDSTGVLMYTYTYANTGFNSGNAIRVDAIGNCFITGVTEDVSTGLDFFIAKLSPNGTQIWQTSFDGGVGGGIDKGIDICTDQSGNVYVTGTSQNGNGDFDIVSMKLNGANGSQIWSHSFNGTSSMDDEAVGIVLSADGNTVYVTGHSTDAGTGKDIVTYALSAASGGLAWGPTITDGTANTDDYCKGIIFSNNDVIICGEIQNLSTGSDAVTIKYNGATGTIIFQEEYDAYSGANNWATGITQDSTGNIGMVGVALNGSIYEYHTLLYDIHGAQYAINKETTGLTALFTEPKICNDTIAHHWYVSGERMNASKDVFVYQITPSGNTAWEQDIDGQNTDTDCATGIAVNGMGEVFVGALSENSGGDYDLTTIKLKQTPVYFPPNPTGSGERPMPSHIFYENKGQVVYNASTVASDVVFAALDYYPVTYGLADRISYKFFNADTLGGSDTIQRVDILMDRVNPTAKCYPFLPNHGMASWMGMGMPDAVTGVLGYERYFVPEIYNNIDLHYYSNQKGLCLYYVVKPYGNPGDIKWEIVGANSTTIQSNNLEIEGFNDKVVFAQPEVYTVDASGNPITMTTTANWSNSGGYGINLSGYNNAWPIIIKLQYAGTIPTTATNLGNIYYSTYYGGGADDGFTDISVDTSKTAPFASRYVVLGATKNTAAAAGFPTMPGTTVSIVTSTNLVTQFLTVVLFDPDGIRKAVNTYGVNFAMRPLKVSMVGNRITVVGNTFYSGTLPAYSSILNPNPSSYTTAVGEGFALQFKFTPIPTAGNGIVNINQISWNTRLNGWASDIDSKPGSRELYITSSTTTTACDVYSVQGAYNKNSLSGSYGTANFQISKFDSLGVRKWATIFPYLNSNFTPVSRNNLADQSIVLNSDNRLKLRIVCDKYGFYLAGESNITSTAPFSKYGAPVANGFGYKDALFARFNSRDSLVYAGYFGGTTGEEEYNDIAVVGPNEVVAVGYSNSWDVYQSNLCKATPSEYLDTTIVQNGSPNLGPAKLLITKFDSLGNVKWSTFWGSNSATVDVVGWAVESDLLGRIYVAGRDAGSFVFPAPGTYLYNQTAINQLESYMVGFNQNQPIWNTRFGGLGSEVGLDMKMLQNPLIAGELLIKVGITNSPSQSQTTVSPFPTFIYNKLTNPAWYQEKPSSGSPGNYDGFITHFTVWEVVGIKEYFGNKNNENLFELFPNPTQNECNIAFKDAVEGEVRIEAYNIAGQLVTYSEQRDIPKYQLLNLNTSSFINGLYIINISCDKGKYSKKLVINR